MGGLRGLGGQRLVVVCARGVGVEGEIELVGPAELEARLAQCVVAFLCPRVAFGQVGRVRRDLVRDHADLDVVAVRKS